MLVKKIRPVEKETLNAKVVHLESYFFNEKLILKTGRGPLQTVVDQQRLTSHGPVAHVMDCGVSK
jgi:hypothetical protein